MSRLMCLMGIALFVAPSALRADQQPTHEGGGNEGSRESVLKQNHGDRYPQITQEERKAYAKVKFYKAVQSCWDQQNVLGQIVDMAKHELSADGVEKSKIERNVEDLKRQLNHSGTFVSLEECLIAASQNAIGDLGKKQEFSCRENRSTWEKLLQKLKDLKNPRTPPRNPIGPENHRTPAPMPHPETTPPTPPGSMPHTNPEGSPQPHSTPAPSTVPTMPRADE